MQVEVSVVAGGGYPSLFLVSKLISLWGTRSDPRQSREELIPWDTRSDPRRSREQLIPPWDTRSDPKRSREETKK